MAYRSSSPATADRPCPACRALLDRTTAQGLEVCRSCGGAWADIVASQRLVSYHDINVIYTAEAATAGALRPVPTDGARECPVCATPLVASTFGIIALDVCAAHRTWFDRDELTRVARSLEFDRERRAPRPLVPDPMKAARADLEPTETLAEKVAWSALGVVARALFETEEDRRNRNR